MSSRASRIDAGAGGADSPGAAARRAPPSPMAELEPLPAARPTPDPVRSGGAPRDARARRVCQGLRPGRTRRARSRQPPQRRDAAASRRDDRGAGVAARNAAAPDRAADGPAGAGASRARIVHREIAVDEDLLMAHGARRPRSAGRYARRPPFGCTPTISRDAAPRGTDRWAAAHVIVGPMPSVSRGGCLVESDFGFMDVDDRRPVPGAGAGAARRRAPPRRSRCRLPWLSGFSVGRYLEIVRRTNPLPLSGRVVRDGRA